MSKSILSCLYLIRANVDTSAPKSCIKADIFCHSQVPKAKALDGLNELVLNANRSNYEVLVVR